jgi:hypothetical protein
MRTGLLILATIACLQGCADDRPPAPPGDGPDTRQAAGLETVPGETGRRHRVARIAKREATRVDEHTIRNRWGIPLALVREDEAHYYYKEYVPVAAPEPTVSTHAGVATSYRTDVPESARLRLDAFGEGLPTHGQWRDGFALADLDGDGHLDLVHGPARGSSAPPVIFLGDGAGRWRPWLAASFPPGTYAYGDAAAGCQFSGAANGVVIVGIAAVDNDVARRKHAGEAVDAAFGRRTGGDHNPNGTGRRQL